MSRGIRRPPFVVALGFSLGISSGAAGASAITGSVFLSQDHRQLSLANLEPPIGPAANINCSGTPCEKLYSFEYQGLDAPPTSLPVVTAAKAIGITRVVFTLSDPLVPISGVLFVTKRLEVQVPGGTKPARGEFSIEPSLGFIASVPSLRGRLFYRSLEPISADALETLRAKARVTLKDSDTGQPYSRRVVKAERLQGDRGGTDTTHAIALRLDRPLPNRNVSVTISGIEADRSASIKVKAAPVTKDSARIYISGQYVANHDGDDTVALEYKLKLVTRAIGRSQFDFGLLTEGNIGSDSLKKPDNLKAALELRYWIPSDQPGWSETSIPLFVEYVTDRKGDNQQLGLGLWFEPTVPAFTTNTLEMQRLGKPPAEAAKARFGWSLVPRVGFEAGTSLRSSSAEVKGDSYLRTVATAGLLLQVGNLSLDTTYQARQLFSDELIVSKNGVVSIEKGFRQYLRSEFGWQTGVLKFSAKLEIGEVPPVFKRVNVTTLGIAVLL